MAATPESTCFSPHAISVNGSAPLITPKTSPSRQALPICVNASRVPSRAARKPTRSTAAINRRSVISTVGSKSRTPTLMKRYDAPQIAARRPSRNGYERVT